MKVTHYGSCLCDQIKFEIEGDFESFYFCHCKYCQKDTGSAHASNLFSTSAKISWITGEHKIKTFNLPSSRHAKSFCQECGSALPGLQMEGKLLVTPAGSLNSEIDTSHLPTAHIFYSSRASWDNELENHKIFEIFPS